MPRVRQKSRQHQQPAAVQRTPVQPQPRRRKPHNARHRLHFNYAGDISTWPRTG